MSSKFTDEQIDLIAKNLVDSFVLDSEKLDEIADSPVLWRNIKREINCQKPVQTKGWMEVWYRQIFAFSAFAALAIGFGIGLIWLLNSDKTTDFVKVETPITETPKVIESKVGEVDAAPIIEQKSKVSIQRKVAAKAKNEAAQIVQTKTVTPKVITAKQVKTAPKQTPKSVEIKSEIEEVKTEFISLSYLPTPESGQIVRVKVPRAMMVSLGVSNNVSKNAEMVSAEVILGDDGSSRAIRFISTNNK
jgi:hypothetical protein